jgi:glycosyltransferase involved in cell wall biosynthesis
VRAKQTLGIKRARHVISSDVGYTAGVFEEIGVIPRLMQLPMLYKEAPPTMLPRQLEDTLRKLEEYDLRFISQARHRWVNTGKFDDDTWERRYSKHNNWIVFAYAKFRRRHPHVKSVLVLTEYGTDVQHTKALCQKLGMTNDVLWIPRMPRIHLMEIIAACDIGLSEFYLTPEMIWGGSALEVMACGKPLVQGFMFAPGRYQAKYGNSPPPLCPVETADDVERWLVQLGENVGLRQQMGDACLKWFNAYNGVGLAQQWLSVIESKPAEASC